MSASLPMRVLVVDGDTASGAALAAELSARGYVAESVATGAVALARIEEGESPAGRATGRACDVVLLDLDVPDQDALALMVTMRERAARVAVVVLAKNPTVHDAVRSVRLGAEDYLERPCPIDAVDAAIRRAHDHVDLAERRRIAAHGVSPSPVSAQLVGSSAALERVRQTVARVAPTDSTILVLGETGVGKDVVARLIHAQSARAERPFVVVDCGAFHADLLHSELFGHEKGAFTGAVRQKHGLFEVAHGGTVFLDEVGDISHENQTKLLRVLETARFRRLGGTRELAVDVRILSATNRNLTDAVARGQFRGDLYFRLATITLEVPPLRERPDDVTALVEHFARRFQRRSGRERVFSPGALAVLRDYGWPGNVRELLHVCEQALVLTDRDVIERSDLPAAIRSRASDLPCCANSLTLAEVERRHVLAVLESVKGNRARAARLLGVSERNLYRLLVKYRGASPVEESPADPA